MILGMEEAATHTTQPFDAVTAAREARKLALRSRRTLDLTDLLVRRPDLRGVSSWSEEIAESVLWSA